MTLNNVLFYEGTAKLPAVFGKEHILGILKAIKSGPFYLKNDWGEWMRFRDECIFLTMYFLALRNKETCCLRFDDFDMENLTVKIRGENNKQKKDRVLPIPKRLMHFYREYFSFPKERFWKGSRYLFPSFGNEHISPERWKHRFRQILKYAHIWEKPTGTAISKYRSYTIRHTRASEFYNKTKDIIFVANWLGHAKLSSTKIYIHTDKDYMQHMREVADKNIPI